MNDNRSDSIFWKNEQRDIIPFISIKIAFFHSYSMNGFII